MARTTEQLVEELADREAIRDLPKRYCHYVWTNAVDDMMSIFTVDGLLSTQNADGSNDEREIKGDDLRRFYVNLDTFKPRPYIHNHVVELQGNGRAVGTCYVELRSQTQDMDWVGTGYYHDEYVKDGGAWKFKARRYKAVKAIR
ncbi:MAG TPA: nuclear transport factor 2 family protein [Caulobacteraceae bacterium]|nr:nuclear transport factor 2 family protein [Caulobacteraceae bacterium]